MTEAQNSPPSNYTEPGSPKTARDRASGPMTAADDAPYSQTGMTDGSDPDDHSLLSPPPAPQGRRSLFRR